ncbi:Xaa-Pro peptidase family protein [Marinomonas sp. S3726]|uniref:M24 family metallopeptidase n=1 Tax=Marinomonas sp. S3726 TaxID=579484 RepID=UPI0005F9E408|nr:Xaa-Pro peptidase family protein [Marinomonas sp. S3726]
MIDIIPPLHLSDESLNKLFSYRLSRIREVMRLKQVSVLILTSPVSLRYAVNFDEYQLFQSHIPTCYLFLSLEGPTQLHGATWRNFPNVTHYQSSDFLTPFDGGLDLSTNTQHLISHLQAFSQQLNEPIESVGLERMSPLISQRLTDKAIQVYDAEPIIEQAKLIKCELEIDCLKHSIQVAQYGMQLMYQALRPGITENQLWSIMHQVNAAHGGDWIEGNMLASGPRTNPWLQEASHRIIEKGDMVAFDTDMIGPLGYIADISRSWVCGGGKGNQAQRDAYRHAYDEVHHNMQLIKPGISFRELSEQAFIRKTEYRDNRYVCAFHGAGLSDEYPKIYYQEDWARSGYDGLVQENMVLCVESYSGIKGGSVGVKLEEMVRVTSKGITPLTDFPFEDELLNDSYLT